MPIALAAASKPPQRKIGWRRTPPTPDTREQEVIAAFVCDVGGQLVDEEPRHRNLPAVLGLGRAPNEPLALHDSDGLGHRGSTPGEVEAPDPQRGHFTEPAQV